MREQLVGYLLGALEPAEHEMVRARLARDESLRRDLEHIRRSLEPLALSAEEHEPPNGLARRTCQRVAQYVRRAAAIDCGGMPSLWRLPDVMVMSGILFVAGLLFFPAVVNSRNTARITACQNNLRLIGAALMQYSQQYDGYFPVVPASGNLAAAGAYAPILVDCGFLEVRSHIVCPASPLADEPDFEVPTVQELEAAEPALAANLKRTMGGSYCYSLGYAERGHYHPTCNLERPQFAIASDAPDPVLAQGSQHHLPEGQNVLFEDGHVRMLKSCSLTDEGDHIFRNELGYIGAGVDEDDSVIGASDTPPVVFTKLAP